MVADAQFFLFLLMVILGLAVVKNHGRKEGDEFWELSDFYEWVLLTATIALLLLCR